MSAESRPLRDPSVQQYLDVWSQSVTSVLERIAGVPFSAQELPAEALSGKAQDLAESSLWTRFEATERLTGEQAFSLSKEDALRLAQLLMAEPLSRSVVFADEHRDAVTELFRQFAGAAALSLKAKLGGDVAFKFKGMDRPLGAPTERAAFQWTSSKTPAVHLVLEISADLATALQSVPLSAPPDSSQATKSEMPAAPVRNPKLELLMDVELGVTLRFGRRQMLLRDVLELNPGAVVELNRQVQDPVELLVGGKVVARGEAVIVDGNYGLRVTEILSPVERIDSLRR